MDDDDDGRRRGTSGGAEQARAEIAYLREKTKESNRQSGRSNIQNVDEKRAAQKATADAQRVATNIQRESQGIEPLAEGRKDTTLKDLRQDPNRPSFADADKAGRDAATRSGAFGSGAQKRQNLDERKALFGEMEKGGNPDEMRKRATTLGVDDTGFDIAQARIANKTRPQTAEEVATFGKDATASTPPIARAPSPKTGGLDLGGNRQGGADTSSNFLDRFNEEATAIGNEYFQTDAKKERLAKEESVKALDKNVGLATAGANAATNERMLAANEGVIKQTELEEQRVEIENASTTEQAAAAKTIAETEQSMRADKKVIAERDKNKLSPALQVTKAMAYASGIGAPLAAAFDIGRGLVDKAEDSRVANKRESSVKSLKRTASIERNKESLADAQKDASAATASLKSNTASLKDERTAARQRAEEEDKRKTAAR